MADRLRSKATMDKLNYEKYDDSTLRMQTSKIKFKKSYSSYAYPTKNIPMLVQG